MARLRYLLVNLSVLCVIVGGAVALYFGVGIFRDPKTLILTLVGLVVVLFIVGTILDAALSEPPTGWVKCNDAWIEEHGKAACATSPTLNNKGVVHYHPAA